jgi:hypothetical protein
VAVTESGDALTITGSPITTSGTINIGFAGTSGQYINGAGDLTTFPSLADFVTLSTAQTITGAKTFTGVVSSIADANAAAYILQGRTSDDLAQIQFKNNAATNTKAKISVYSVGTNGGAMQFLVKPDGLPEVSSLSLSSNQADFETSVTSTGIFRGTTLGILNSTFTTTIGASLTANRTITIPDLSGTLALLEGNQEFSGYKTFTGGAQFTGTAGTYTDYGIAFTKGSTPTPFSSGTTNLYSDVTTNNIVIRDTSSNAKLVFNNSTQTYTYPALSGTMALLEGTQTFSGLKTFDLGLLLKENVIPSSVGYTGLSGDANGLIISKRVSSTTYTNLLYFNNTTSNTYTFPAASGTMALLEGTQTFSGSKTFSVTTIQDAGIVLKDGVYPSPSTGYVGFASNGVGITIVRRSGVTSYNNNLQFPLASNDYNFPNATGTIALTSDIPSITGLVPYTGATANVNLGTFDLTADVITGATGSFASSGGSDTFAINHSSGSGIALNITKGGNGEGLYINKTSGSGNALTVIGSTSLGALSGTSATFSSSVGINGVSATYPLYVRTGTNQRARFVDNGGLFQMAVLNDAESGYSDMSLGNSAIVIKSVGNVGIGTSSPSERLMLGNGGAIAFTNSSDAKKWHIQYNSNDGLNFVESDVADFRLFLKAGGNVGIGVVPSAWNSASRALQLPSFVSLSHQNSGALNLMSYAYESSANVFTYAATGVYATRLYMDPNDGVISFFNSATGTAGNTITFNERFRVNPNGIITIPNLAAAGSRAVIADSSGNLSAPVSDISVKENIKTIGYGLNEILKMNPVWFDFINEYKNYGEGRQNGNIAQEMELIIPEAVFTTPTTGKMGINYDQLHAVYIKAIQEQQAQIEELKAKIK